jgi:hypothetical protein
MTSFAAGIRSTPSARENVLERHPELMPQHRHDSIDAEAELDSPTTRLGRPDSTDERSPAELGARTVEVL